MPSTRLNPFLAAVALCAGVLALAIHLLAVVGRAPVGMAAVFVAFALGLLCFGALMVTVNRRARERGDSRASIVDLFAPLPLWARLLFAAVFLYAGLNFALFFRATGGAGLERQADGRYVLSDHGRLVRTLDERGVRAVQVWQVRAFSGHILPFLVLPGLYFWFAPRGREAGASRAPLAP
jgi:hypothetical protein